MPSFASKIVSVKAANLLVSTNQRRELASLIGQGPAHVLANSGWACQVPLQTNQKHTLRICSVSCHISFKSTPTSVESWKNDCSD